MSAIFTIIILQVVPIMVLSYVKRNPMLGAIINFFTVLCFCGQHEGKLTLQIEVFPYRSFHDDIVVEVARELESPFTNEPNDIPLGKY